MAEGDLRDHVVHGGSGAAKEFYLKVFGLPVVFEDEIRVFSGLVTRWSTC